jgi:hypothetical protein
MVNPNLTLTISICILASCSSNSNKSFQSEFEKKKNFDIYNSTFIEIYENLLDTIIQEDVLIIEAVLPKSLTYSYIEESAEYDTCIEYQYFKKQINQFREFRWDDITNYKYIIHRDSLNKYFNDSPSYRAAYNSFKKDYGNKCFVELFLPLFSFDHSLLIIQFNKHCDRLDGYGEILIYRKIDGKYNKVYQAYTWES